MSSLRYLLVAPKLSYLNRVKDAMGEDVKPISSKTVANVGSIKMFPGGLGMVAMQVKGDYAKMCERMEAAWLKYPRLERMGVILPGFTDQWMREHNFVVRFSMYMLNAKQDLVQFIHNRRLLVRPEKLDDIYKVPKKRKRQEKKTTTNDFVERNIAPEEAKREEDACVVCCDNKITHMCMPCSHYVMCGVCAAQVKEDKPLCPMCRTKIQGYVTPIMK